MTATKQIFHNKGIALLLALIIMAILFVLGTAYLSSMMSESGIARNQENSEKAFFLAEAGIDRAMRLLVETPDADQLPWSYQENMSDGYYIVDITEATDIGDDYVRVVSTGYVDNATRISEAIVYLCAWKFLLMSNTDINLAETAVGRLRGDIHANQSVFGIGIDVGFYYIDGSRQRNSNQNVRFSVRNNTGAAVNLDHMTVTWDSPTAYYSEVRIDVAGGTNYGTVWDRYDNGGVRASSGQTIPFDEIVVIPNGSSASVSIRSFKRRATGWWNPNRDMDNTEFTVVFHEGSTLYPVSVGLAGSSSSELEVDGAITEGDKGDPIVSMPSVDMQAYRNRATKFVDGDYVFNGYDQFVEFDLFGTAYYFFDAYYVTGKVTINSFHKDLNFPQCMITAGDGIEMVNEYMPSGVDYVELSRQANTNNDVVFQITNNTDSAVTLTEMTVSWDAPPIFAAYEYIEAKLTSDHHYTRLWSYPPPSGRASNGETVTLDTTFTIPAGETADVRILNFRNFPFGLGSRDMDREVFNITFGAGSDSYSTVVMRAGELITPSGGRIYFRRWRPQYPTLITKDGNITETGAEEARDRDFDGIIFSEKGMVELENFKMEGCIVAHYIELKNDLDMRYRPIMVPDPPPDFIAGIAFIKWQENY